MKENKSISEKQIIYASDIENGINADFELCRKIASAYNNYGTLLNALKMCIELLEEENLYPHSIKRGKENVNPFKRNKMKNNNSSASRQNEYEFNHELMKRCNERRAINEEQGLKKFYKLKETFAEFKNLQERKKFRL